MIRVRVECGPWLKDQIEGVIQGWRIKLRVWSRARESNKGMARAGRSNRGCMWSMAGGSN